MQVGKEKVAMAFSEACERNKEPILNILRDAFSHVASVLEVGSGTGQHAVYFTTSLPHLTWQPSEQQVFLPALKARFQTEAPANLRSPFELDVRDSSWPVAEVDAVFSANTLHYMSKDCVKAFFGGVGRVLTAGGVLVVYGPFRYAGEYTSASNARFDEWLKEGDPDRAIRDFEWVNELAESQSLSLFQDFSMPASNQLLVWLKTTKL